MAADGTSVQDYVDRHQLSTLIQTALNIVVKQRAPDPAAAMAREFDKLAESSLRELGKLTPSETEMAKDEILVMVHG